MTRLGIATGVSATPDWKSVIPIVLSIAAMCGTVVVAYAKTDKEIAVRLSVIESQRNEDSERLKRVEDKLDRLIERGW